SPPPRASLGPKLVPARIPPLVQAPWLLIVPILPAMPHKPPLLPLKLADLRSRPAAWSERLASNSPLLVSVPMDWAAMIPAVAPDAAVHEATLSVVKTPPLATLVFVTALKVSFMWPLPEVAMLAPWTF